MGGTERDSGARLTQVAEQLEQRTLLCVPSVPQASVEWVGTRGGQVQGLALEGNYAYLAATNELRVVDVSDSASPRQVSSIATTGSASGIAVSGQYAYVSVYGKGLEVFDISDPTSPVPVGNWDGPAQAISVEVDGTSAYIAAGTDGLDVIDISDPTKPVLAGVVDTPGSAIHLAVSGNHVFVADDAGGLQIVDTSNPQAPTIVGHYVNRTGSTAITSIALSGTDAVLANAYGMLAIVNVADPTAPAFEGQCSLPSGMWDVAVSGAAAYVAGATQITIFDISDPSHPYETTTLDLGNDVSVVKARSGLAYIGAGSGIQVVEMPHPYLPVLAGATLSGVGDARAIELAGGQATVFDQFGGHSYDISDPANPVFANSTKGQTQSPGTPHKQVTVGGYTYTATGMVVQVSDATHPDLADIAVPVPSGVFDYMGYQAQALAVSGTNAYLVAGNAGLLVINISDPAKPTIAAQYKTLGCYYTDISLSGQFAYVTAGAQGLEVFRLHHSPREVTSSVTSVDENVPGGTYVSTLGVVDAEPGTAISYSLVDAPANLFQLDGDKLTLTAPVDYEAFYPGQLFVIVRATDSNGLWIEQKLQITINYRNQAPFAISLSNTVAIENSRYGGGLSASDPNYGEKFTYSLVDGEGDADNALFAVTGDYNWFLVSIPSANFDFETRSTYTVRLRVTDSGGLTFEKPFTITVTDVAETLFIAGTAGNDVITVTCLDGDRLLLRYTVNGDSHDFLASSLNIDAKAGDDLVNIDPSVFVAATIFGRAGNDTLIGGSGCDSIYGNGGNDLIRSGAGDDFVGGGVGNDTIITGAGRDAAYGGAGNDSINGGADRDTLDGGGGDDVIIGGNGNDSLSGGEGNDLVHGGAGNDWLDSGAGNDIVLGEAGDDTIRAGDGDDWLYGGDGADKIYGQGGNDYVFGGAGNDTIVAGTGSDSIYAEGGNDLILANDGFVTYVDGGTGTDTVYADNNDTLLNIETTVQYV